MRVNEIFYSIQGEGRLAGQSSVFVRLAGCPLRCVWCDTPYALKSTDGENRSLDSVLEEVKRYPCKNVVVTGGDPIIAKELPELMQSLKDLGKHTTIETSAIQFRDVSCDLMSMSPKLSHSTPWEGEHSSFAESHEKNRLNVEAIQKFIDQYDYQLKFVVQQEADLSEIDDLLSQLNDVDPNKVLLMPEGRSRQELHERSDWMIKVCLERGFRFSSRLHIDLWGNKPGR